MTQGDPVVWWTAFGAIAQAAGALATFLAVAASLWIVLSERKIKAEGSARIMVAFAGDGSPGVYLATIGVTNTDLRPFKVSSIGWRSGWFSHRFKRVLPASVIHRFAIQLDGGPPHWMQLPCLVEPAGRANFNIAVSKLKNAKDEARKELFDRRVPILGLAPIHAMISIDGREPLFVKAEKGLADFLRTGEHADLLDTRKPQSDTPAPTA